MQYTRLVPAVNHPRRERKNGFTLIELLVVIAIIAILASILFPVFARARENARRTSCLSNLKQMGLGVMMYTQDFDERYPPAFSVLSQIPANGNWGGTYYWFWQNQIYPYTKSNQIFYCPNGDSAASPPYAKNYGANSNLISGGDTPAANKNLALASVASPATTYMLMDSGFYIQEADSVYDWITSPTAGTWYLPGTRKFVGSDNGITDSYGLADYRGDGRHFDGNNVTYADGHAKWIKTAIMWNEAVKFKAGAYSAATQSAWNPFNSG